VSFWPLHKTAFLYDPINRFPTTLRERLRSTLAEGEGWTIHDLALHTQHDPYQCGVHAILFSHLILALTADGPHTLPLNTIVLNHTADRTGDPLTLLANLKTSQQDQSLHHD
jgi:hypothetical protein